MRKDRSVIAVAQEPVKLPGEDLIASRPSFIPPCSWVGHWLTISEFSRLAGRPLQTVYYWVREGTLSEFGISTYEFRFGRKHSARVFVKNPYV